MNETDATVVRLDGDYAWVRTAGAGHACGACARKEGCHTAGLGSVLDGALGQSPTDRLLRLPNDIHARAGDAVVIRASDGMVLRAAWLAYGVPLLLGLLGAMLGLRLLGGDAAAVVGMLSGLAGGFFLMRRGARRLDGAEPILSIAFKRSF